jgi:peptidoglycan/xylan/chitin deacetylase (PgdA/CDA1 family)
MNLKHTFRDGIIFFVTIFGISVLHRSFAKKNGPLVRILALHDVDDALWFEELITMLVQKYHVITPEQFHAKEFNNTKINILLTFDDGYQSWIDTCVPILEKYKLKGLFFINSGLLDDAGDTQKTNLFMQERLFITPKKALSWEGARTLLACGHTIGGHTLTHPDLSTLYQEELDREIQVDKKNIEQMLSVAVVDFAYPFGTEKYFTKEVIQNAKNGRYDYQYSAISGFYSHSGGPLQRTLLEKNQPIAQVSRWIGGGYDIFWFLKDKLLV